MNGESSHQQKSRYEVLIDEEEQLMAKIAQRVRIRMRMLRNDQEKNFKIERLKALGETTFTRTTDPTDVTIWMNTSKKCFKCDA